MNEDVFVVARHIQEFRDTGVVTPIAPFETIKKLHKKDEVLSLAKSIGIPIPETIVPQTEGDIRHFCNEFGPHVVLKRTSSSGARGVFYLTENQIIRSWNGDRPVDRCPFSGFVLQQCVTGVGHGVSMLFCNGTLRAKFTHKRLREKDPTGGMSTLRVGVVNRVLEEYAQRLLESVQFHGVAMVEFRHDERSGKSWLLEVNPRFWGSVALAIQSGVDFPYLLYRLATEGDVAPVEEYRTGLVVKWILGDIGAARRRPRSVDSDQPSRTNIRAQGYDDFYWDEPLPFLAGAVLSVWKFLGTRTWTPDQVDLNIERLVH
jgi:predicted ATP-grasp superfamily ATP-dependent carboligase